MPVSSIADKVWNPYQVVSGTLFLLTLWFIIRQRQAPPTSLQFSGLLAWTICLDALIVPLFGMLHIVMIGLAFVIILNGAVVLDLWPRWVWLGTVGLFLLGLASFILPLLFLGASGLQITTAELIYRFAMPIILLLASLPLLLKPYPEQKLV